MSAKSEMRHAYRLLEQVHRYIKQGNVERAAHTGYLLKTELRRIESELEKRGERDA